jgi:hypothetical protein
MPSVLSFVANFFRRHTSESMARLLAFFWFVVAALYATLKVAPDVAIFGLMSANCLTCLGLRSKPTAGDGMDALTPAPDAALTFARPCANAS